MLLFFNGRPMQSHISYGEYFKTNTNFIPFKEIISVYRDFARGNFGHVGMMITGNFIAFMPMAFFIPILFRNIVNIRRFAFLIISMLLFVEMLQFITRRGSFDIDDIILNFFGAVIAYMIIQTKLIKNICSRHSQRKK
jgi:glycopeptide antibiotics resistance protein